MCAECGIAAGAVVRSGALTCVRASCTRRGAEVQQHLAVAAGIFANGGIAACFRQLQEIARMLWTMSTARTATRPCYHRCCVSAAGLPHSSRPASAAAVLPQQLLCCSQGHPQTVWCVRWAVMCVVVPVCVSSRSATAAVVQSRVLTDYVVVWGGQ